jgi:hypothetical protein
MPSNTDVTVPVATPVKSVRTEDKATSPPTVLSPLTGFSDEQPAGSIPATSSKPNPLLYHF